MFRRRDKIDILLASYDEKRKNRKTKKKKRNQDDI